MGWKRNLFRHLPLFSKIVLALDRLEQANHQLANDNHVLTRLTKDHRLLLGFLQLAVANEIAPGNVALEDKAEAAETPVPPAVLRYLVSGSERLQCFLDTGRLIAQAVQHILARQGKGLGQFKRCLDFGCGCGRVLRHLKETPAVEFHGTDCNPVAIHWCQQHLPFAQWRVNSLKPSLSYPDRFFDFVFAFSIFTHLTEPLQTGWMKELRRVIAPGGYLLLTVHGDKHLDALSPSEREEYRKGNLVVRNQDVVGTNYCAAFHPQNYVRRVLAKDFRVADFLPEGPDSSPPQDLFLLENTAEP